MLYGIYGKKILKYTIWRDFNGSRIYSVWVSWNNYL